MFKKLRSWLINSLLGWSCCMRSGIDVMEQYSCSQKAWALSRIAAQTFNRLYSMMHHSHSHQAVLLENPRTLSITFPAESVILNFLAGAEERCFHCVSFPSLVFWDKCCKERPIWIFYVHWSVSWHTPCAPFTHFLERKINHALYLSLIHILFSSWRVAFVES